ncbi:MAG TPA: iron-sulfur cluster assembly accessory protein [Phycisphaerae bacterium]|jgi:iron-sulfur cluster assembly protein|nr:iron-sulfur cluster assembly accessory protein [Phycisphaerae bacterium]HOB75519.1 iron-sulfur cluster assembly accessory protein [Phycisphaerae bacterium]HOJ55890.1 iron-sulfur cluster assembly accessory protein [Phycisphaerae bacterium]HOL27154.1 iron-sulfur cluster assembly accessory protein [Phycisphaerae bacterium]HPP21561.1 iron-sulfur cluster assembly accessory protein [Phycisphaerae bacterium]
MALMLTERAAQEVKTILEQQNLPIESTYLRLGVKGGGCSGFSYSLDLTETKSELDEEFDCHGIKLVCDPKSYLYLDGTTLDFKDEIMGRGFVFNNPNATHTCGCGSSFQA